MRIRMAEALCGQAVRQPTATEPTESVRHGQGAKSWPGWGSGTDFSIFSCDEPQVEPGVVRDYHCAIEPFRYIAGDVDEARGVENVRTSDAVYVSGAKIPLGIQQGAPRVLDCAVRTSPNDRNLHDAVV
jgi:hypothetical protein